ncbi:hypothetical protein, partial [Xanthomonas arboricola]|uniref:hypothetical protein n=1 Tax=Xanthomonas arboricola TaxID=56448 RepID=UPI000D48BDDE
YGRILRDAEGKVAAIVEQKDANDEQRRIRTINTGILTAESTALLVVGILLLDDRGDLALGIAQDAAVA